MEKLKNVKWERVGRISKIWLYPVKSCCAVSLQTAQAETLGLTDGHMRDRSFMIATKKGTMVSGRMIGATLHITPLVSDNTLILKRSDMEELRIDLDQVVEDKKEVSSAIFGDPVIGLDCGDAAATWLKEALKKEVRLMYHANIPSPRKTEELVGKHPLMKGDDNSLYADVFPYMLMTKESIADLQSRVKAQIAPENFRPNLLVEGTGKAYDEDDWAYIKIGNAIFRNLSPCSRCIFTTIDHKTGIKEPNMEPLRTLRTYRCAEGNDSPSFGINLGIEVKGTISDDDEIFVTRFSKM